MLLWNISVHLKKKNVYADPQYVLIGEVSEKIKPFDKLELSLKEEKIGVFICICVKKRKIFWMEILIFQFTQCIESLYKNTQYFKQT